MAVKTKLIVNVTRGECLCVGELADRPLPRMKGLIGREGLPAGEGLLLRPAPSIHTAFMRFPIDAVFLDRDMRVLGIVERLQPWRVAARLRARAVLELAAGETARRGVKVGDRLSLRDRKPVGVDAAHQVADVGTSSPRESSRSIIWSPSLVRGSEPLYQPPTRILVVSEDRHFRSVTTMLLAHRGCAVTDTANVSGVVELLAHSSTDVVVVDTGSSPTSAQRAVVSVRGLALPVGVVLVGERPVYGPSEYPVVAKWGPFADLVEAIERASESRGRWTSNDVRR